MMTAKELITSIAEYLDGVTLQHCTTHETIPYNNVPEFLKAVEEQEAYGNETYITQVWLANNNVQRIDNDNEVLKLLGEVTAIQFVSRQFPKTEKQMADYIMHGKF